MGFKAGAQNTSEAFRKAAAAALFLLVSTLLVACDGGDGGLSRADVEEIVREELADAPARPEPASDISSVEVEAAIRAALAGIPQQEPWLSRDEVEQLVGAAIPSLSTPQPGLTSAQLQEAIRTALAAIPQPQPGLTSTEAEKIARGVVASIPPRPAPAEAIGALARAKQAVVAGDDRQLPPTSFFRSQEGEGYDDDSDDAADGLALIANIESLLDVVKGLPIKEQMLRWHYRSRDGRLIAFSNNHIYGEALTAFPGTVLESPLTLHELDLPPASGRSTRSHPAEVERVVDLILEHARQRPDQSLGVIAFGSHHGDNIEEALRRRLAAENDRSLDPFFATEREERFFIKNIERVQGDERDVIILSVGYHKAANGTLPYRFGPLNQEGGERRLNVAITRARSRIHLVAGFSHHDMDPGRSSAEGVELLRQYLEFAASGGTALGGSLSEEPLKGPIPVRGRIVR